MYDRARWAQIVRLLGPAFVASVAYVDPGNFAANFSAGAQHGYLLLWVLVLANLMAMIVQYLSAKIGIVTGKSLPELMGERLGGKWRFLYWLQAEGVAIATDIAEVVGGALALYLLFGLPLPLGGLLTAIVSMGLLVLYTKRSQKVFERVIIGLLLLLPVGFFVGLVQHPPIVHEVAVGLVPRFDGQETILLAVAMLGATVMPHVVYLHSSLSRDRFSGRRIKTIPHLLKATRFDIVIAMAFAGLVNISMLLFAASAVRGLPSESLEQIYRSIGESSGGIVAILFAVGLLISGFASTAVGSQAGATIMAGLYNKRISLFTRRAITVIPAIILLMFGIDPTVTLIISQAALSFGIPFALIPLLILTADRRLMHDYINSRKLTYVAMTIVLLCTVLNMLLLMMI
ncbi:MAG: Nramp family divalent metal transporter [Candidatus Saccharimonas sp.]|nr:Nramp family divalent metal transporter [Candidatus Saccharimonas sp.]